METLTIDKYGDILLLVHSKKDPDDDEWQKVVDHVNKYPTCANFVLTYGGGPSAYQRCMVSAVYDKHKTNPKTVVMENSFFARAIMSSFTIFKANIVPLKHCELDLAFTFLGIKNEYQKKELQLLLTIMSDRCNVDKKDQERVRRGKKCKLAK